MESTLTCNCSLLAQATFTGWDWLVLIAYFVGITAFGLWVARKIRGSGGYFLGDRKLPWWVMMGQAFGTGTHAEQPVAQAGVTYGAGFATIWYQWKNMLITPLYWLMSPWYRRTGRTTLGEVVEDRYGHKLAMLYTIYAIAYFIFNQGAMLKGAAKVIAVATGGEMISPNQVVLAMTAAFLLYSFFGGLVASAYTDFVQGFLIIAMSFMLIPMGLVQVGGFRGMRQVLPGDFFTIYSSASGVDAFTILMLTINGLVGITAMPHTLSMNATGRSERSGRVGNTYGNMVKRFCTIGWGLTGLIVAALVIRQGAKLSDAEHAFGYACLHLLGPGLVGLMVSCVLAANMSTCSNFMVNTGALFTQNIYRAWVNRNPTDRQLLITGRISGLLLTLLGVVFALKVRAVLDAFLFTETIAAFFGVMIIGGILWRRANRVGAWAGTIASFAVYYAVNFHQTDRLMLVYKWQAWPFFWAMLAGFGAFIVLSLLTRQEDSWRIDAFFGRMNESSDGIDIAQPAPAELNEGPSSAEATVTVATHPARTRPSAAELGQDLLLLDLTGWLKPQRWRGFFHRYREDLVGFALAWLTVGALLAMAWGIMQIGA